MTRFNQKLVDATGLLVDLPQTRHELYAGILSTLSAAFELHTDSKDRESIIDMRDRIETEIRSEHTQLGLDPAERVMRVFNSPMGASYLNAWDLEHVDELEKLRDKFLDANDAQERETYFSQGTNLKAAPQRRVEKEFLKQEDVARARWSEANGEVDRIMKAARAEQDSLTTADRARATSLPESTVAFVEHEYRQGSIVARPISPQPGPSSAHGSAFDQTTYEWIRPLTPEQEVQAMRAIGAGRDVNSLAKEMNVDPVALNELLELDLSLVPQIDDLDNAASFSGRLRSASTWSTADDVAVGEFAGVSNLSPEFIAALTNAPLDDVQRALRKSPNSPARKPD